LVLQEPFPQDLCAVVRRVVWFQEPEETLKDPVMFLAFLMTHGTADEIVTTKKYFFDADFLAVLNDPPSGIFDARSWNYWNLLYKRDPVPPLPVRRIPGMEPSRIPWPFTSTESQRHE
jgi:hypothetical protein